MTFKLNYTIYSDILNFINFYFPSLNIHLKFYFFCLNNNFYYYRFYDFKFKIFAINIQNKKAIFRSQ